MKTVSEIVAGMLFLFFALCVIWGVPVPAAIVPLLVIGGIALAILALAYAVSQYAALLFVPDMAAEMHASGHDGKPRNWILKDGTVYSGMFYVRVFYAREPGWREIKIVDITPAMVERIEYP